MSAILQLFGRREAAIVVSGGLFKAGACYLAAMAGYPDVVAWLRALPVGCELAWGDELAELEQGFGYDLVEAAVPLLREELGWNWIWSIVPSDDERTPLAPELEGMTIRVEVEGQAGWLEVSRGDEGYAELSAALGLADPLVLSLPYDATLELAGDGSAQLVPDAGACALISASPGRGIQHSRRVWTTAALERALEEWIREHSERDDLRLRYSAALSPSPFLAQLRLEEV